jgi:hypothetical protein
MGASGWLATTALLCWASAAYSQTTVLDREIKAVPGRSTRRHLYEHARRLHGRSVASDPPIRCAEHGTVTVRRATLKATNVKQCVAAELPALVAFYRPKAAANDDRFELEVSFAAGRKQIQRFHVTISNGANEGQRI